jgi:hypothetical protein
MLIGRPMDLHSKSPPALLARPSARLDRSPRCSARAGIAGAALLVLVSGCTGPGRPERVAEARRVGLTLRADFAQAVDASNRAVMAQSERESSKFAQEADQARQRVSLGAKALGKDLQKLDFEEESRRFEEFRSSFTAYEVLDRSILGLAVAHTNLKAMRLSFGPVHDAASAFSDKISNLSKLAPAAESCGARVRALEAVAAVRELELLEGQHIAEASDSEMTNQEARMKQLAVSAQSALSDVAKLVPKQSTESEAAAKELAHFDELHQEVLRLSRQNSNVRSTGMALGERRTLSSACERLIEEVNAGLTKRAAPATR